MARIVVEDRGQGRYRATADARGLRSRAYATTPGRAVTMVRIRLARALRLARSVWPNPTHTAPDVASPAVADALAELDLLRRHRAAFRAQLPTAAEWRATMIRGAVDALTNAIEAAGREIARLRREGR